MFVLGGMTYSEMRTAYRMSDSLHKDIYIGKLVSGSFYPTNWQSAGSSHVYTPTAFVDDMKAIQRGGVGSKAIPEGLQDITIQGEPRPFQTAYDAAYPIKDPPPPPRPSATSAQQSYQENRRSAASEVPVKTMSSLSINSRHSDYGSGSSQGPKPDKKEKKRFFGF